MNKFDFRWDFTNYHYYNPFAFFHNRLNFDIVPASVNTFFNPLIDIPLYLMIKNFNNDLNLIFAVQGIWFGLLLYVFYKFVRLFFDQKSAIDVLKSVLTVVIAATGQATYFQAGSSTNEIQMALIAFVALYILFNMIKNIHLQKGYKFFVAGSILGCGLGLKSTIIYICISSGISLILCNKFLAKPVKYVFLFAFGRLFGYLLVNGWWMYKMWVLYDNPFFPFLNGIFKSPYFDDFNYTDRRFIRDWLQLFIYPYVWLGGKYRAAEIVFWDFRGSIFYTLALGFILYMSVKPHRWIALAAKRFWCFYAVLLFLSYVCWMLIFSIHRYFVVVEMLSALFFVKIAFSYKTGSLVRLVAYYSLVMIVCGILILNIKESYGWSSLRNEKKFAWVENIKLPSNSLVKLYNFPTAGVIVELAKNNNDFRALGYKHLNAEYMKGSDFVERGNFRKIRDEIEQNHKGEVVVIYRDLSFLSSFYEDFYTALVGELKGKYCRKLKNNLDTNLCICVSEEKKNEVLGKGNGDEQGCNIDTML